MKTQSRIRLIRRSLGWTQEKLAKRLQVSRETVGRWESGQPPIVAELALEYISEAKRRAEEKPGNI